MINDKMLYNEGNKKMFGYENTEVENVAAWWRKNIHPVDMDQVLKILDEVYEKKEHLIQLEYRFLCADGTYKYILDRGFVIYNEDGKPSKNDWRHAGHFKRKRLRKPNYSGHT